MAEVYSYGLKSVKYSPIDPLTGLPEAFVSVGKIYRDTGEFTVDDPTQVDHLEELSDDPVVTVSRRGPKSVKMRLMDTSAANKVLWLGGTVTTVVDEPDQWNEPDQQPDIYYALQYEFEDGSIRVISRAKIMTKDMPDPKKSGFSVLEVMAKVLKPLVPGVPITFTRDAPAAV